MFILLFIMCQHVFGAEAKKSGELNKELGPKPFNVGDFTYTSENRRDPFEKAYAVQLKQTREAVQGKAIKKGYELEELKVVGLLKTDANRFVMMEDMQGKGILFKKGDFINKDLWIVDVLDSKVALGYKLKGETRRILLDIPRK
jgi:Tfp pilus assembly protein PilP